MGRQSTESADHLASGERALFARYLDLLGVRKREPSLDALTELVTAHLARVPFENVSKILLRKRQKLVGLPGLERFLDGIERYHLGGTCYSTNLYLNRLLAHLGYDVRLCGADMKNPDVHIVSIVRVDGREFLVDVGYAAPFLEPIPRDLTTDYAIVQGGGRYVLRPQEPDGRSRLEFHLDGNLKHGYVVKPRPRKIEEFTQVILDSYRTDATFMNALLIARFFPGGSHVFRNMTFVETVGTSTREYVHTSRQDLARRVEKIVGIPGELVLEALAEIPALGDPWS